MLKDGGSWEFEQSLGWVLKLHRFLPGGEVRAAAIYPAWPLAPVSGAPWGFLGGLLGGGVEGFKQLWVSSSARMTVLNWLLWVWNPLCTTPGRPSSWREPLIPSPPADFGGAWKEGDWSWWRGCWQGLWVKVGYPCWAKSWWVLRCFLAWITRHSCCPNWGKEENKSCFRQE